ncbi:MAG TPA: GDSL-type esterase/lipase family protein [Phycisphaerae bacterium]|nr:GDSL-type esterase/lipase family protein [Phycisphaerae bacterium]
MPFRPLAFISMLAVMPLADHLALAQQRPSSFINTAAEPAPRDGAARQRFELLNQRTRQAAEAGKTNVVFIGDSITEGWEGAGRQAWERHFASHGALNLGISGDRTQHVLWRLNHGNVDGLRPKVVVVMIGTNNSNGDDNTVGEIAAGVRAVVSRLREKLPEATILLLDVLPRGEQPGAQRGKLCQVNQVIARLHDAKQVVFLPIGHHFLADDGVIDRRIMPDYLHLSPEGYETWAAAIEPELSRLLGS